MSVTVTKRIRVNARIPDKEGKYRDEITQEAEFSITETGDGGPINNTVQEAIKKERELIYAEIKRLGGCDYREEKK